MNNLNIIYEDDDVLVVNKPAGILVHATKTSKEKTIADLKKEKTEAKKEKARQKGQEVIEEENGEVKGIEIQRYKGLGEMNPEQLWDTTMNPQTRVMKQVMVEDAADADHVFSMLMGDEVPPRKRFIQTHAKSATLDI